MPVLPRTSSAMSGFFFWGIRLEPVQYSSPISAQPNAGCDQMISSSAKRERCVMASEAQKTNSATKSRSETASRLLAVIAGRPRSRAIARRSSGMQVPASAPLPVVSTAVRTRASRRRSASRSSIST